MGGRGEVIVDENSRTSVPTIYAVGDVTDRINLTPCDCRGHAFADRTYGGMNRIASRDNIASAVSASRHCLCWPERGRADEDMRDNVVERRAMKNTISGRVENSYMKLVVETASDRVVGVT